MAEENMASLMQRLHNYVPFLQDMIDNLKSDMPQHGKIVALHAMITDKKRKFKFETLKKCEEVIKKMQCKMVRRNKDLIYSAQHHREELAETPRSPSPEKPEVIPTIRSPDPDNWSQESTQSIERYVSEMPSIYSTAAETIGKPKIKDRLGVIPEPDPSRLPLSYADLELLNSEDGQTKNDFIVTPKESLTIKPISKVSLIPSPIIKPKPKTDPNLGLVQIKVDKREKKVEKIISEADSTFGNLLSSIDDQIITDKKKRRDSTHKREDIKRKDVEKRDVEEVKHPKDGSYKRIADKYNPRPRRPDSQTIESSERFKNDKIADRSEEHIETFKRVDPRLSQKAPQSYDKFPDPQHQRIPCFPPESPSYTFQGPRHFNHFDNNRPFNDNRPYQNRPYAPNYPPNFRPHHQPSQMNTFPMKTFNSFDSIQNEYDLSAQPPVDFYPAQTPPYKSPAYQSPAYQNLQNSNFDGPRNNFQRNIYRNHEPEATPNTYKNWREERESRDPRLHPREDLYRGRSRDRVVERAASRSPDSYRNERAKSTTREIVRSRSRSRNDRFERAKSRERAISPKNRNGTVSPNRRERALSSTRETSRGRSRTRYDDIYSRADRSPKREILLSPGLYGKNDDPSKVSLRNFKIPKKGKTEQPEPLKVETNVSSNKVEKVESISKVDSTTKIDETYNGESITKKDGSIKNASINVEAKNEKKCQDKKESKIQNVKTVSNIQKASTKDVVVETEKDVGESKKEECKIVNDQKTIETVDKKEVDIQSETKSAETNKNKSTNKCKKESTGEKVVSSEANTKESSKNTKSPPAQETKEEKMPFEIPKSLAQKPEIMKLLETLKDKSSNIDPAIMGVFGMFVDYINKEVPSASTTASIPGTSATKESNEESVAEDDEEEANEEEAGEEEEDEYEEKSRSGRTRSSRAKLKAKRTSSSKTATRTRRSPVKREVKETETVPNKIAAKVQNRTRSKSIARKKRRNELDKLHDDIKETMGDDVLSGSKRSCTTKKDTTTKDETEPALSLETNDEKSKDLRVVLEKLPEMKRPKRRTRTDDVSPEIVPKRKSMSRAAKNVVNSYLDNFEIEDELKGSKKNDVVERSDREEQVHGPHDEVQDDEEVKENEIIEEIKAAEAKEVEAQIEELKEIEDVVMIEGGKEVIENNKEVENDEIVEEVDINKSEVEIVDDEGDQLIMITDISDVLAKKMGNKIKRKAGGPSQPILVKKKKIFHIAHESDEIEFVDPDIKYYWNADKYIRCKICSYRGKNIVHHYIMMHPKNDVYCSRLSPEDTELAVKDAEKYNLDELILEEPCNKRLCRIFSFTCRFCKVALSKQSGAMFYDHLTMHTGESRFKCALCNFRAANRRNVNIHLGTHATTDKSNIIELHPPHPNYSIVFGYVCSVCNFLQLRKSAVDEHIQIYHLEDTARTRRISMSFLPPTPATVDNKIKVSSQIISSQSGEVENVNSVEEEATETPDLTVFMCNAMFEEEDLEEIRLKKMKQIQESLSTKRTSFVNKLQSRLETVDIGNAEEERSPPSPIPVEGKESLEKIAIKVQPKRKIIAVPKVVEVPTPKVDTINNIVSRLQGKLSDAMKIVDGCIIKSEDDLEGEIEDDDLTSIIPTADLPQLSKVTILNEDCGKVYSVTIIDAVFKEKQIDYICRIPSCVFRTNVKKVFSSHCLYTHKNELYKLNCLLCDVNNFQEFTMIDIFQHLCEHIPSEALAPIVEPVDTEDIPHKFSFKITNVTSLAPKKDSPSNIVLNSDISVDAVDVYLNSEKTKAPTKPVSVVPELVSIVLPDSPVKTLPRPESSESDTSLLVSNASTSLPVPSTSEKVRHLQSTYGCAYCLYRAISLEYVELHEKMVHPEEAPLVHEFPGVVSNKYKSPDFKPLHIHLNQYTCVCGVKCFVTNNFKRHLEICDLLKGGNFNCALCNDTHKSANELIAHFADSHRVDNYHCRYCMFCGPHPYDVYEHFVSEHPNFKLEIVSRFIKGQTDYFVNQRENVFVVKFLLTITKPSEVPPRPQVTDISNDVLPLSSPSKGDESETPSSSTRSSLDDNSIEIIDDEPKESTGLTGLDLYICQICETRSQDSNAFKAHINKCILAGKNTTKPFTCYHCNKNFKSASNLSDHLRIHGINRIGCSLCPFKHAHPLNVRTHMKTKHKISNCTIGPVDPKKRNADVDEFIARPGGRRSYTDTAASTNDVAVNDGTVANEIPRKLHYSPSEIHLLPIQPIYKSDVYCSICNYATKVKMNLVRHMGLHMNNEQTVIPVSAPVNPVPCLEKNELMFDKMTNLALSSHASGRMGGNRNPKEETEINVPPFVPSNKRYVCGANNCNYLCLEESMLRHHLQALHTHEERYTCAHCDQDLNIDGNINVDDIIKHLRLHDNTLYKCGFCSLLSNAKNKVEKHCGEKHSEKAVKVVTIREEVDTEAAEPEKKNKPWRCGMCKSKFANVAEVTAHVENKHGIDSQYKCSYCNYKSFDKSSFPQHFQLNHEGYKEDIIVVYFNEDEMKTALELPKQQFDTTPLWVKNKMNHIKHIRGILLEEQEKISKKSPIKLAPLPPLIPTKPAISNLDLAIEAVATGSSTVQLKRIPRKHSQKKSEDIDIVSFMDGPPILMKADTTLVVVEDSIKKDRRQSAKLSTPPVLTAETTSNEVTKSALYRMSIHKLLKGSFMGVYGPLGKPYKDCFLCPLCAQFRTKKADTFEDHLCEELHYNRYQCGLCEFKTTSLSRVKAHELQHLDVPLESFKTLKALSPNTQIDVWIGKVLMCQERLIKHYQVHGGVNDDDQDDDVDEVDEGFGQEKNVINFGTNQITTISIGERMDEALAESLKGTNSLKKGDELVELISVKAECETSGENQSLEKLVDSCASRVSGESEINSTTEIVPAKANRKGSSKLGPPRKCPYCEYTAPDIEVHKKRHLLFKPMQCGHCNYSANFRWQVYNHCSNHHPDLELLVKYRPVSSTPIIFTEPGLCVACNRLCRSNPALIEHYLKVHPELVEASFRQTARKSTSTKRIPQAQSETDTESSLQDLYICVNLTDSSEPEKVTLLELSKSVCLFPVVTLTDCGKKLSGLE